MIRPVGVEEEFLLVDPVDGRAVALAAAVLKAASSAHRAVEGELQLQQVEVATEPCRTLSVGRAAADGASARV